MKCSTYWRREARVAVWLSLTVSGVSFYISGGKGTCVALAAADVESVGGRSRKPRQGHLA